MPNKKLRSFCNNFSIRHWMFRFKHQTFPFLIQFRIVVYSFHFFISFCYFVAHFNSYRRFFGYPWHFLYEFCLTFFFLDSLLVLKHMLSWFYSLWVLFLLFSTANATSNGAFLAVFGLRRTFACPIYTLYIVYTLYVVQCTAKVVKTTLLYYS